jgi:Short C-terminal domain
LIDQRHDRISSVKAHKGVIGANLVVNAGGDEWTLRNVYPKEAVDQIAQVIRDEAQGRQMPVAAPAPAAQAPDLMDQLKKLGELRDAGVLTDEEFEAKTADLLSRL